MWDEFWMDRGKPWEFDAGPAPASPFAQLFAETPNYRGIGLRWSGKEEFRWHFGPMFYRGRLEGGGARVLVVGQEGAQDESLAHRSFTGGTGARMQHLLHHLGITHSYLFLNTFVYPIFGQYDRDLRPLAQDPRSPIVEHRHALFDLVAAEHPLRLVIAVGVAAKESVATWIRAHGGTAAPDHLEQANAQVCAPGLRAIGVLHPGGAGKSGNVTAIVASFERAVDLVAHWSTESPGWLPADPDGSRQPSGAFKYRSRPIPFRDFPYGTCWRLGRGATSSNRRDEQTAIQLFSDDGTYNAGQSVSYAALGAGSRAGYAPETGDLAYEPPRAHPHAHDRGPSAAFAALLQGGVANLDWPDFTALGLPAHPSFGFGPVYRGRLDHPSVLVLADQASDDDLMYARALCGEAGQVLQSYLRAAGLTTRYGIVRTLPVDCLSASASVIATAAGHAKVRAILREAMSRAAPKAVLSIGPAASAIAASVGPAGTPVLPLPAHGTRGWLTAWQQQLGRLVQLGYPTDVRPSSTWSGAPEEVNRHDLPYGTLRWQATSGDRTRRARCGGKPSPDYVKVTMPHWASSLEAAPLTSAERAAVDALKS